jgi:hypothetical protein
MKNNIFRASYTVLDQCNSGNWEQAIKTYFKLEKFITPAMLAGREYHEKWAKHIETTKTLPLEFGGKALKNPIAEQKTVVHLDTWLDLVGIIDCYDSPIVYEWKTGKQSSETYAGSKQGGIYAMLATLSHKYVERIEIHHFDQYRKLSDMSIIWVTPELMDEAHNYVVTIAGEMHTYFETNNLYQRFGANLLNGALEVNGHA